MDENFEVALADLRYSGMEIPWRNRKIYNLRLAHAMQRLGYNKKAVDRVKFCASSLIFEKDVLSFQKKLLKKDLRFCKNILCPICQGRRAEKNFYNLQKVLEILETEDGNINQKMIMMTLTIKNTDSSSFSETIDTLIKGFGKLVKRKVFKDAVKGYYRTLEVTVNNQENYHPHLHVLCVVEDDYFQKNKKKYLSTEDVQKLWKEAIQVDYTPICNIEKVRDSNGLREVSKYILKAMNILEQQSPEALDGVVRTLLDGLYKRRLVAYGGVMKQASKKIKLDEELYVIKDEHCENEGMTTQERYYWSPYHAKDYIRDENYRYKNRASKFS